MNLKNKYFLVLDKGFLALKDYMGSDEDIEQAARVSYGKGTRKVSDTRNLIRYLIRHRHTGPFEQAELKFHIRTPIYVWRQWVRHRTASLNEVSQRYSEVPFFCQETPPNEWRLQSKDNKQGGDEYLAEEYGILISGEEETCQERVHRAYRYRLQAGIAREQARKELPLSTYTEAFWKIDLHNLLHFLTLRCDSHAQLEIRQYANIIGGIVKELFPITFEAWIDYAFCAKTFSRIELKILPHYTLDKRDDMDQVFDKYNLSKRERNEFLAKVCNNIEEEVDFNVDTSLIRDYSFFYDKE